MSPDSPLVLVKGHATEEEVAALVTVLSRVAAGSADPGAAAPVSAWASQRRKVRASYPHGPGGWRASALPR